MTDFEYDNLPDEMTVQALEEDLFPWGLDVLINAVKTDHSLAKEIKIAYAYDRKGYMELDTFGGRRNPAYSSVDDDIVIQVTVRVHHPSQVGRDLESLKALEKLLREQNEDAERTRLEAELVQAEAEMSKAAATARTKRARLEELRKP
jgi:capsule polysaccharide export protein KpsC/LpsZ